MIGEGYFMNVREILWDVAQADIKKALPILSFPAAQKMDVTVAQMVQDAQLQASAMEIVATETETLAAVSLMDLSVEAEAFGATVRFFQDEVPAVTGQLISSEEEAQALQVPDLDQGRAKTCIEGVRLAKQRIQDKPVLAGMIGPYSLAGRLMDVTEIMYSCYDEPEVVHVVLEKATQYLIRYGNAMKQAGADGIMMAEPLAGILSPDMAAEFSVPYVKRIIAALRSEDFAVIYHNCGNSVANMLPEIFSQGADAYHFGNAVDMLNVMRNTPETVLCMGNIDPATQFANGTVESMTEATGQMMAQCGSYKNFVPSSGCDIPFHAKWENIHAFFTALHTPE